MAHRFTLAAMLLAAMALPAAAQQTTQSDTAKKKTTVTESAGAIADTAAPKAPNPNAAAPSIMAPSPGVTAGATNPAAAGEGKFQPTSGLIKVDVKVDSSLANTVKISADSAFALAKASPDAGEISSAELEMTDHRLVYQVKMVKGAGASTVYVDAMNGEVVKDKKFGGVKAAVENQEETKKLYDTKRDSAETKKP